MRKYWENPIVENKTHLTELLTRFSWFIHQVFAALGVFLGGYLRTMTGTYELAFWVGATLLVFGVVLTTLIKEQTVPVNSKTAVQ